MTIQKQTIDVPMGAYNGAGVETICARVVTHQDKLYRHCAPGVVYMSGGSYAVSTIPSGYTQSSARGAETGLLVDFEVADERAMDLALAQLAADLKGECPVGFMVEASSSHLSFREMAAKADPVRHPDDASSGCGCGTHTAKRRAVVGSLRAGLAVEDAIHWSPLVPALLYPRLLLGIDLDLDGEDDESCSGGFVYDCHAHWQWSVSFINPLGDANPRFTVCHASKPCAKGTCQTDIGTPASGWRLCWCQ